MIVFLLFTLLNWHVFYRCIPCHTTCETCSGPGESECVTCRGGRLALGGICYTVCPDGYYTDKKRKECMHCPPGCATCNSATCLTCSVGYTLNKKGKCVREGSSQCSPGQSFLYSISLCVFICKMIDFHEFSVKAIKLFIFVKHFSVGNI